MENRDILHDRERSSEMLLIAKVKRYFYVCFIIIIINAIFTKNRRVGKIEKRKIR